MKKSNAVLLTTIFPASQKYLEDFFNSLQQQTSKDFDVLVINDGVENFHIYETKFPDLNMLERKVAELPAKNREIGIKIVKELGYKFLIFGDSDDFFSDNRIEESIKALKINHIVINELTLFNNNSEEKNFLKNNLKNINTPQDNILNGNVFGFSNIGLRAEVINSKLNLSSDLIAVDWFFVTSLLLQKDCQIKFLDDVHTHYRQHSGNIIGMSKLLTIKKLELGIQVKQKHYKELLKFCKTYQLQKYSNTFETRLKEIKELKKELSNTIFREKYIALVNANINEIFSGWWSEVISLEKFYYYENKN